MWGLVVRGKTFGLYPESNVSQGQSFEQEMTRSV